MLPYFSRNQQIWIGVGHAKQKTGEQTSVKGKYLLIWKKKNVCVVFLWVVSIFPFSVLSRVVGSHARSTGHFKRVGRALHCAHRGVNSHHHIIWFKKSTARAVLSYGLANEYSFNGPSKLQWSLRRWWWDGMGSPLPILIPFWEGPYINVNFLKESKISSISKLR